MQSELIPELITPASIIFGVVFGAGRVKAAIDEERPNPRRDGPVGATGCDDRRIVRRDHHDVVVERWES